MRSSKYFVEDIRGEAAAEAVRLEKLESELNVTSLELVSYNYTTVCSI